MRPSPSQRSCKHSPQSVFCSLSQVFLMYRLLIIEFVATTASDNRAENAIARKDKKSLPIPFCCWRYRPTKAYFMYTIKWAVMQYVIIRPAVSLAGIITNALGLYCESGGYNPHFAYLYLTAVDFVSITSVGCRASYQWIENLTVHSVSLFTVYSYFIPSHDKS
jgi:hypothetical protein